MNKFHIAGIMLIVAVVAIGVRAYRHNKTLGDLKQKNSAAEQKSQNTFNKSLYSIDTPDSLWRIVNKKRPLPADYVPADLTSPNVSLRLNAKNEEMEISQKVTNSLESLFHAAEKVKLKLLLVSGYRSFRLQTTVYNTSVKSIGQAATDQSSAKPGTSEHQTGLAFDVGRTDRKCELEQCFADTDEGKWVGAHAHAYGFTVRYLKGKEAITGYGYEPWHLRYVGKDLAIELHSAGQTMEEFFGL